MLYEAGTNVIVDRKTDKFARAQVNDFGQMNSSFGGVRW